MLAAPGSGVPGGSFRGDLLFGLSRLFHNGGKIHLIYDHETRGSLLGVFPIKPGSIHAATSHSVGTQVLVELCVPFLVKGFNNRSPHSWRRVGGRLEERHYTYFLN